jgi:2-dehydropantoate 2-reductase
MRIVMIGAGAMGATFGAWLARAGADVTLFDVDQAHIGAIVADGLKVETPAGELHLRLRATSNLAGLPLPDMAIVLVDSNATRSFFRSPTRARPSSTMPSSATTGHPCSSTSSRAA